MVDTEVTFPVAFHFSVSFSGSGPSISDAAFQEVSGLEHGFEVETVVEGGENRFVHQLPKPSKSSNLKLKRALVPKDNGLVDWCKNTLEQDLAKRIEPKDIAVTLLDAEGDPVSAWSITNAYPIKWEVGGFDAMKNEIAVETIELAYLSIKRN